MAYVCHNTSEKKKKTVAIRCETHTSEKKVHFTIISSSSNLWNCNILNLISENVFEIFMLIEKKYELFIVATNTDVIMLVIILFF